MEVGGRSIRCGSCELTRDADTDRAQSAHDLLDTDLARAVCALGQVMRDVLLIVDRRHRVLWMNPAAERFTGVSASKAIGRHCYEVMGCAGAGRVRGCSAFTRRGHRLLRSITGRDGSSLRVEANRYPLVDSGGTTQGSICCIVPRNVEADLDRTRTEFLSNVSHELRTPLTSLAASIELLMNYDQGIPEDVSAVLRVIHRSTLWLHNLVENLLCASSIQVGRFQVDPQPTSLVEILEEAVSFVMPLLEKKQQTLKCDCPPRMSPVMADAQRIGQVLINLLHNASKYGPTYDTIGLTVEDLGSEVRLSISEHGPGIPPEEREHLFERFYRQRPAQGGGRPGVGLGLAIVRSIVELHGGAVGVQSALGEGSTFWFTLPKATAADLKRMREREFPGDEVPGLDVASAQSP